MIDPIFWLGLSILLVAVSLTAVLITAIPALQELARAARSVEKLADTLRRELPPTLEAIRLTGMEISDLTDDVSEGVKSAGQVVKQVDQSVSGVGKQAQKVQVTTRSVVAGVKAAWKTFRRQPAPKRPTERLPQAQRGAMEFRNSTSFSQAKTESQRHKGVTDTSNLYEDNDDYEWASDLRYRRAPHSEPSNTTSQQRYEDLESLDEDTGA